MIQNIATCDHEPCGKTAPVEAGDRTPAEWTRLTLRPNYDKGLDFCSLECAGAFMLSKTNIKAVPRGSVVLGLEDARRVVQIAYREAGLRASDPWAMSRVAVLEAINAAQAETQPPAAEPAVCEVCDGAGSLQSFANEMCETCGGSGRKEG